MSQPFELPGPADIISTVHSRAYEAQFLSPLDSPVKLIPLVVTLSTTTTSGSASYEVPAGYHLRLQAIRPHIALNPVTETLSQGGTLTNAAAGLTANRGTALDVLVAKAMNCRVALTLQATQVPLFPQGALSLYDLMQYGGGAGARFLDIPGVLPSGTVVQLDATLVDTAALAVGQATYYGVELVGALVESSSNPQVMRWPGR